MHDFKLSIFHQISYATLLFHTLALVKATKEGQITDRVLIGVLLFKLCYDLLENLFHLLFVVGVISLPPASIKMGVVDPVNVNQIFGCGANKCNRSKNCQALSKHFMKYNYY